MSTTNDNLQARAERTPCPLDWPCERGDLVDELCAALGDATDRIETLEADVRYLLSFVPPWATEVPEGLDPTFYGTLSADGDRKVKARVDQIRNALREMGETP